MASTLRRQGGAALALYLLCSFGFFGAQLAVHHDGWTFLGRNNDPQIFVWAFAWWPHAIAHGLNPIVPHVIWAPDGADLAWTGSAPALAIAFIPVTLLFGPLAAFNVAVMLMPALAAWTAFVLCRHLTRSFWPSLAGGYLFGFSSYELGQTQAHLFLSAIFLVPLLALAVLRYVENELTGVGLALRFGVMMAVQLLISIEIAFTVTLALVAALVLAFAFAAPRQRIARAVPALGAGYALAATLAAPFVYYWLTDFHRDAVNPVSPALFSLDLLNVVVPTGITAIGHTSFAERFTSSSLTEAGGYVGLPALAVVAWYCVVCHRRPAARFLAIAFVVAVTTSMGIWLVAAGHRVITLPWEHIGYLPLFDNVLPARFSLYIALVTAIAVALWASSPSFSRRTRITLTLLAVLAIVPNAAAGWTRSVNEPHFVAAGQFRNCIRKNERVAIFPFQRHGNGMLWQAEARFWFEQTGGFVAPLPPPSFTSNPDIADITTFGSRSEQSVKPLLTLVRVKKVDVVAVDATDAEPWRTLLAPVKRAHEVGGVLLYRFRGTTPVACV